MLTRKAKGESGGKGPRLLNVDTGWRWTVKLALYGFISELDRPIPIGEEHLSQCWRRPTKQQPPGAGIFAKHCLLCFLLNGKQFLLLCSSRDRPHPNMLWNNVNKTAFKNYDSSEGFRLHLSKSLSEVVLFPVAGKGRNSSLHQPWSTHNGEGSLSLLVKGPWSNHSLDWAVVACVPTFQR